MSARPTRRAVLAAALLAPTLAQAQARRERMENDPLGVVRWVYNGQPMAIEQYGKVFSRRLGGLLEAALKASSDRGEPVSGIDVDFTTNSQDVEDGFQKTLTLELLASTPGTARVRASFRNFKVQQELVYDLVNEDKRWRIDDVTAKGRGGWVLSKLYEKGARGE